MQRILLLALVLHLSCASELLTIQTSRGTVQGFDQDFGNDTSKTFYGYGQIFLGIPFAKPPLGERRFQLPEPLCQYNDQGEVHNATYYRPMCWQLDGNPDNMSEDCLYLNVMTPNISGNYPVMVFIHGGAFAIGGAERYHWKGAIRNLVSRGVVVVTIQYRLGLLGFFTTYTETFPPNRGMYDQILALKWVNEEITNFGGDSSRITIFGKSAGAASASDLALSPLARGLFHQLIQSSGSPLMTIETIENPRWSIHQDRAQQVCQINSTDWGSPEKDEELLNCLINAAPMDFVSFDSNCFDASVCWNVEIDGAFLPDYPEVLAENRPKYPLLIGDMLDDYASSMPGYYDADFSTINSQTNQDLLKMDWPNFADQSANISEIMIAGYTNGITPAEDDYMGWAKLTTKMNTGRTISAFSIRDVQWHRDAGNDNVWLFTFAHPSMLSSPVEIEGWIPVAHFCDLHFIWFYPIRWENFNASDADYAAADNLGRIWTEFTKTGELPLPRVGATMDYVEISDTLTLKSQWRAEADEVYNEELPSYLGEWPPLKMSDESWATLHQLGEKVLSKWNPNKCSASTTESSTTKPTTTRKPATTRKATTTKRPKTTKKPNHTKKPKHTTRKHRHSSSSSSSSEESQ